MIVTFFTPGLLPKSTKQQDRVMAVGNKVVRRAAPKGDLAEVALGDLLRPHIPARPLRGPIRCVYTVTWPWRKGDQDTKKRRILCEEKGVRPYIGKPDLDNFEKRFFDTLKTLGFIADDSLIYDKHPRKLVGANPGLYLYLEEIQDDWEV